MVGCRDPRWSAAAQRSAALASDELLEQSRELFVDFQEIQVSWNVFVEAYNQDQAFQDWCVANPDCQVVIGRDYHLFFEDKTTAVLFKLTWGGQ